MEIQPLTELSRIQRISAWLGNANTTKGFIPNFGTKNECWESMRKNLVADWKESRTF